MWSSYQWLLSQPSLMWLLSRKNDGCWKKAGNSPYAQTGIPMWAVETKPGFQRYECCFFSLLQAFPSPPCAVPKIRASFPQLSMLVPLPVLGVAAWCHLSFRNIVFALRHHNVSKRWKGFSSKHQNQTFSSQHQSHRVFCAGKINLTSSPSPFKRYWLKKYMMGF